jgi:hypothetical protein
MQSAFCRSLHSTPPGIPDKSCPTMATGDSDIEAFIEYWSRAEASERANAQPFLLGLARLLDLPAPSNTHADGYSFEFPVKIPTGPSETTDGRIDLYRPGQLRSGSQAIRRSSG